MSTPPPFYFPITDAPLRMEQGLVKFGKDFGNGEADRLFFPRDRDTPRYVAEKARVLAAYPECNAHVVLDADERRTVDAAAQWMSATFGKEGQPELANLELAAVGAHIPDDFVILRLDPAGRDRALWLHVCFPSGWKPKRILGKGFVGIHEKVPAFDQVIKARANLLRLLVTKGPFIRFVWTICADAELDHHPDHGRRQAWTNATRPGYLRVERQLTIPLSTADGYLFLIRTYIYPFTELRSAARQTLARALEVMPAEFRLYKRLGRAIPVALRLLRQES